MTDLKNKWENALLEWQPIETAPKDGTLLGYAPTSDCGPVFGPMELIERLYPDGILRSEWGFDLGAFSYEENTAVRCWSIGDYTITHWMPLPPPPANWGK